MTPYLTVDIYPVLFIVHVCCFVRSLAQPHIPMRFEMTSGRFQMSDGSSEHLKKFVFSSKPRVNSNTPEEKVEIIIPEVGAGH